MLFLFLFLLCKNNNKHAQLSCARILTSKKAPVGVCAALLRILLAEPCMLFLVLVFFFLQKIKTNLTPSQGQIYNKSCSCEAQDHHPLGDDGFPKGNNQGLCPCMLVVVFT
jgi:hypothetical protein